MSFEPPAARRAAGACNVLLCSALLCGCAAPALIVGARYVHASHAAPAAHSTRTAVVGYLALELALARPLDDEPSASASASLPVLEPVEAEPRCEPELLCAWEQDARASALAALEPEFFEPDGRDSQVLLDPQDAPLDDQDAALP